MTLPGSIDRDDVPAIVERCRPFVERVHPPAPPCDARDVSDPRLPTIEVLAILALAARRRRHELRLEHASPALIELLDLCGLETIVRAPGGGAAAAASAGDRTARRGRPGSGGEVVR